ncbi:hypothetical protein [Aeromicrobium sp. A1-2]|uniref:hypothetical protein n=1 Tax=Aeromicrobium sp. A1-2 TaxID=2107713 RepID=UPI0013C2EAA9|nr:hypothetical protein [Aeromicrobium sp. A1-2]
MSFPTCSEVRSLHAVVETPYGGYPTCMAAILGGLALAVWDLIRHEHDHAEDFHRDL